MKNRRRSRGRTFAIVNL